MPTVPLVQKLSASSEQILNAIRNSASANYQSYVPVASESQNNVREIGLVIMNDMVLQNEFLSALVNRIGRVIVTSKLYSNPWSKFKKGMMEFGESLEEVFVNIAKPFNYNVAESESKWMKREIPDVRAAFHVLNYQKFYKATIQREQLRQAFMSWQGITDLIAKIVDSMYTAANYDEFQVMKYLLARHILNGELKAVQVSTDSMKSAIGTIKSTSNNFEFMSPKYNLAHVQNYSLKDNQYIIVNSEFDATMDVEVLATAFNMEKADFMGHRVLIDSFGSLDTERLAELFNGDSTYTPLESGEVSALNAIPAVLVDKDFFMIFDNMNQFTEDYNGQGLYWQYWYHTWKTFSISPYANAVVFVPGAPTVSAIDITPSAATVMPGQSVILNAAVTSAYYATKAVTWSATITGKTADEVKELVSISPLGVVTVSPDFYGENDTTTVDITVTATSVAKSTVTDTATVTVYNANDTGGEGGGGGGGG